MHAHGIHGHITQLPTQLESRKPLSGSSGFVFPLDDEQEGNLSSIDPNGSGQQEAESLPDSATGKLNLVRSPVYSGPMTADLTVEPMIYGASGKIKYIQNNVGQRVNGSA